MLCIINSYTKFPSSSKRRKIKKSCKKTRCSSSGKHLFISQFTKKCILQIILYYSNELFRRNYSCSFSGFIKDDKPEINDVVQALQRRFGLDPQLVS